MKPAIYSIKKVIEWKHADALFVVLAALNAIAVIIEAFVGIGPEVVVNYCIMLVIYIMHAAKHVKHEKRVKVKDGKELSPDGKRVRGYWRR